MKLLLKSFKSKKKIAEPIQTVQAETVTRPKRFPKISVIIEETNASLREISTKKSSMSEPSSKTELVDINAQTSSGARENSTASTQGGTNITKISKDTTSCFMDHVCIGSNHLTFKQESETVAPNVVVKATEPAPKMDTTGCFMDQACIGSDDLMTAEETMTAGETKSDGHSIDCERSQVSLVTLKHSDQGWLEEMKEEIIIFAKSKVASTTEYIRDTANVIDQLAGVKNGEGRDDDPTFDGTATMFDEASYFTEAMTVGSHVTRDQTFGKTTFEDDATCLTKDDTVKSHFTRDRSFGARTMDDEATYFTKDGTVRSYVTRGRSFGTRTLDDEATYLTTAETVRSYVTRDRSFGTRLTIEDDATYLTKDKSVRPYVTRDSSIRTRTFEDDASYLTKDKSVRSRVAADRPIGPRTFEDDATLLSKDKSVRSRVTNVSSIGTRAFEDDATYLTKDKSVRSYVTEDELTCLTKDDDVTYVTGSDYSFANQTASTYRTENHFTC
ncbi:hypothetical protein HJC23_000853 [Cyclotella cryptica]|uniref:Uncharacterized protein n=1 Tax=Cyclotella cryptica TaxID=29204 RepID=A0ABD3PV07_9STRA|eukprot:CCRYP_011571-RA/>CCRYP_011571-RA protein AED:0.12 eAED:0.12 QI:0/-1/0/1/-1/1/1/0/499